MKQFSNIQKKEMEECIYKFLSIVDNPDRIGLKETPKRVVKYWCELLEGQLYTNDEIAEMYDKCFPLSDDVNDVEDIELGEDSGINRDLVVETHIPIFSHCEHHLALMYDMDVTIAYLPNTKIIGLSKMARVAEMVGKRLQLQEKIGADINEIMRKILGTEDVAVLISGKHGCMTARGAKSREALTRTASLSGEFKTNAQLRNELYNIVNK